MTGDGGRCAEGDGGAGGWGRCAEGDGGTGGRGCAEDDGGTGGRGLGLQKDYKGWPRKQNVFRLAGRPFPSCPLLSDILQDAT